MVSGISISMILEKAAMLDVIPTGTVVRVIGLVSRPALNGALGRILGLHEPSGRYMVSVAAATIRLMPSNVLCAPMDHSSGKGPGWTAAFKHVLWLQRPYASVALRSICSGFHLDRHRCRCCR